MDDFYVGLIIVGAGLGSLGAVLVAHAYPKLEPDGDPGKYDEHLLSTILFLAGFGFLFWGVTLLAYEFVASHFLLSGISWMLVALVPGLIIRHRLLRKQGLRPKPFEWKQN